MRRFQKQFLSSKKFIAALALACALAFAAPPLFAHSKLLRSQPADKEILREQPKSIELVFKERVQTTDVNGIVVTNGEGKRFDKNNPVVSEDGKKLLVELENLSSGVYSVQWRALSADNHLIKGNFSFTLVTDNSSAATQQISSSEARNSDTQTAKTENQTTRLQSAARWLLYLPMTLVFGGFAFLLFVLVPALRQEISNLSESERISAYARGKKQFARLAYPSLFLILVFAFANLILQTSSVLDVGLIQAFAPSNLFLMLTQTSYGTPFLVFIFTTLALFGFVFFVNRREAWRVEAVKIDSEDETRVLWVCLIVSSLLFAMLTFTGHARASVNEYTYAELSDYLHQVAVGVWVGGLFHLILTLSKVLENFDSLQRLSVLSRAIALFNRLAIFCVILLALTGVYSSWVHVGDFSSLRNTSYGQVLLAKTILFVLMLALGGINSFVVRPRVEKFIGESDDAKANPKIIKNFYRALVIEIGVGVAALFLAAVLAFLPPARSAETTESKPETFGQSRVELKVTEEFQLRKNSETKEIFTKEII